MYNRESPFHNKSKYTPHLLVEFYFRYLTWLECEAQKFTWQSVEDAHHTWESFEKAVPEEE